MLCKITLCCKTLIQVFNRFKNLNIRNILRTAIVNDMHHHRNDIGRSKKAILWVSFGFFEAGDAALRQYYHD